ncbi:RNA-binding protein [Actinopolymorpha alba]|uniref:RNA-binding protein n=1 Tax=Actinopolymorpha alba TaxID=533267 RepID=UPI000476D9EA|nr:RNA-binding protein [Actinopolymorpha alba]
MFAEALEHVVRGIVAHPDDVRVTTRELRRGRTYEVRVHPDDFGRVIGRRGRTAHAIRTVIGALDNGRSPRIDFVEARGRSGR